MLPSWLRWRVQSRLWCIINGRCQTRINSFVVLSFFLRLFVHAIFARGYERKMQLISNLLFQLRTKHLCSYPRRADRSCPRLQSFEAAGLDRTAVGSCHEELSSLFLRLTLTNICQIKHECHLRRILPLCSACRLLWCQSSYITWL